MIFLLIFPNKTAVLSGEFVRFTAEVHDTSGENDYRFFGILPVMDLTMIRHRGQKQCLFF